MEGCLGLILEHVEAMCNCVCTFLEVVGLLTKRRIKIYVTYSIHLLLLLEALRLAARYRR